MAACAVAIAAVTSGANAPGSIWARDVHVTRVQYRMRLHGANLKFEFSYKFVPAYFSMLHRSAVLRPAEGPLI